MNRKFKGTAFMN